MEIIPLKSFMVTCAPTLLNPQQSLLLAAKDKDPMQDLIVWAVRRGPLIYPSYTLYKFRSHKSEPLEEVRDHIKGP